MQCAILQAINREADTDEAALERSEKHTFDPRRCGAGDCGQRGYDGMRPEDHALDGYGTWLPPRSGPCCWGWGMPAPRWRWSCCAACISFCAALKRARSLFPPMLRLCGASAGVVLAQRDSACWQRESICVPVLGGGGRVHGADRPGAEKRLCAGRPHEGRTGLHRVRGASRCLLWSIWMS